MKYFYLTNKEFLYTCNVRGSAHTVTVTDTFPLVFIDALFLRITKGCGLRGTGNRDRHRGTGMLIIALHVYTNTAHRTVCTDRI